MKRLISILLGTSLALTASAQSWQDALLFSENEYGGTARSVAMGNALTAVGGDLGSIGLNPAGSAVAGYSQFVITPGISLSLTRSSSDDPELSYGDQVRTLYSRVKMPNLGFVLAMNTGQRHGLKRISFGFVSNSTSDFTERMYASGINSTNSYCGTLAGFASGYPEAALSGLNPDGSTSRYNWWNFDEYADTFDLPWEAMVGYRSGMFGTVKGQYLGITDYQKDGGGTGILAPLYQKYGLQTKGYKHDMVFNLAANYDDTFYFGANLGVSRLTYGQSEYWMEAPSNPSDFPDIPFDANPNARFRSLQMKRLFSAKGAGVYLKAGVLWRPAGGLRIGAAIQTPTYMRLETRTAFYGKTLVDGMNLPSANSPEWDDTYALISPFRFNTGVAYALGSVALLSADYEFVHYGQSYYRSLPDSEILYSSDYFDNANADIKDVLGASHMLRLGMEVKPVTGLSLRAGYAMTTSGIHNYLEWVPDGKGNEVLKVFPLTAEERRALVKHQFSAGFGYAWGAFFTDVAFRYRMDPTSYVIPYSGTSEVSVKHDRFDAMITLGWRF